MRQGEFEPRLADWVERQCPPALPEVSPLAKLAWLGTCRDITAPDDVARSWWRTVVRSRRLVDQAESALFDLLLAQGRSWAQVADVLGLPDGRAARKRHERLKADLRATDPG